MKDVAASLFVRDPVVEEEQSDFETGYYDSEGEYWPLQVNDDLMTKTDNEKFAEKKETKVIKIESSDSDFEERILIGKKQNQEKFKATLHLVMRRMLAMLLHHLLLLFLVLFFHLLLFNC